MPTGTADGEGEGLKVGGAFAPGMLTRGCRLRVAAVPGAGEPTGQLLARLGARERTVAESIRPEKRRRDFVLGRLAARRAVLLACGVARLPGRLEVLTGARGEPVVTGDDSVQVSLSQSKGLAVACAWRSSSWSVGIDLERIRPTDVLDSAYAFSRREREVIRRIGGRALAALVGWTVKEAAFKALALRGGPEALEIVALDPAGRATVRAADARLGIARARVRRLRASGADYVVALAWSARAAQNW